MKKILILIHDMEIGGAQKSLLSFCQSLISSPVGKHYSVYLMPIKPAGPFFSQVPEEIQIIQPPKELQWLGTRFSGHLFRKHFSWHAVFGEISWLVRRRLKLFPKNLNIQQCLWTSWKDHIPELAEHYDVAISYMDGVPNYFVMDRVRARKKVLWVHNEYQKLGYDSAYDANYFGKCNGIITISESCRNCILAEFPEHAEKIYVLENITSGANVVKRSMEYASDEFAGVEGWKLLSVGRLNPQKGFDLAIDAARSLRDSGIDFLWLIVGEGTERKLLQGMIEEFDLSEHVRLIGAKDNPYVYMSECDLLIQPSRAEGKSIVLDEAKILCKPIVATNYTTVRDSIEHDKSGWIVEMTPEAIAEGILMLCRDEQLRIRLRTYLQNQPKGNEAELKKYIDVMF